MPNALKTLYICYLSVEDPLVHTQVIAYLEGVVAAGHTVHLLTFDPKLSRERRREHEAELSRRGIVWHSLRYHKRPSLPATVYDALVGALVGVRLVRRHMLDGVHARNHVPAAMALIIRRVTGCRLIFDIRGLMAEEYVDAGRWKRGGLPYRLTDGIQRAAIRRADGVVMLTEAVRRHLFGEPPSSNSTYVIPCCADLAGIDAGRAQREAVREEFSLGDRPVVVYVGKFSGRYLEREMIDFYAAARREQPDLAFLVLTQLEQEALRVQFERAGIAGSDYRIARAAPSDVGRYLAAADFAICFYRPAFSEIAASPTKIGEYLGAGLPVVASVGIGDTDELLRTQRVGVVVEDFSDGGYEAAAGQIKALSEERETRDRCRSVARERLSLDGVGIPRYAELYRRVASGARDAGGRDLPSLR
jgi:glycosyltransferase involved in cell wall biosynthesis